MSWRLHGSNVSLLTHIRVGIENVVLEGKSRWSQGAGPSSLKMQTPGEQGHMRIPSTWDRAWQRALLHKYWLKGWLNWEDPGPGENLGSVGLSKGTMAPWRAQVARSQHGFVFGEDQSGSKACGREQGSGQLSFKGKRNSGIRRMGLEKVGRFSRGLWVCFHPLLEEVYWCSEFDFDLPWTFSKALAPRLTVVKWQWITDLMWLVSSGLSPGAVRWHSWINEVHSHSTDHSAGLRLHSCQANGHVCAVHCRLFPWWNLPAVSSLWCEKTNVRCQVHFVFQKQSPDFNFSGHFHRCVTPFKNKVLCIATAKWSFCPHLCSTWS